MDQNGDGQLDINDKIKMGSGVPKIAMAFNVNLSYKNFDLVANFIGNFGVKRFNGTKYQLQRMDKVFNYGKDALRAWTPENKIPTFLEQYRVTLTETMPYPTASSRMATSSV